MNQGDNSTAQTCEGLPPPSTLATSDQTQIISSSSTETQPTRRPRFGTSSEKKFGGALAGRRKWPPRRVSFPSNDTHLVTGYLEPANPWEYADNVNREDLIATYRKSCIRHNTDPLESVLEQLEKLELTEDRCDTLTLNGQKLEQNHCESLEEILKRVQFKNINLEGTSLDDESCVALFDMMEYYESAVHLNISSNKYIGIRGWQACSHMIKKTQCLEQLDAKNVTLNEQHMPILSRALRIASHLQVLKLENCGLSGRPTVILVAALKLNTGLKELYLADNNLVPQDAMQLGSLLRTNNHLQLLDVSNNNIQDGGVGHISDGLIEQRIDDKDGKGLGILVLWNNHITRNASQHFSRAIARCKTLEMLNIGQNMLTNEALHIMKESLQQNRTLLRLGMQSTHLTCEAAITLADIIASNHFIQRIDLRDNHLQIAGLAALAFALKKNKSIIQLDLDDQPRKKLDGTLEQYLALVTEIRGYCTYNDELCSTDESTEESESPQHRSRLSSVSSRKISLTCQTLPRSPPPVFSDGPGRTLLEPKRTSGGRLRSPAPSPIPSPSASPIPSPSRNRFVVSRVSETSLSSTNSSTSSSPITPPSRSSSPTCFFPPATGASRFRVTVVEPVNPKPAPKPVIAFTNTNVTVGFQFKVDSGEQANYDELDDVFRPDPDTNANNMIATKNEPDMHVSPSVNTSSDSMTHLSEITVKVQKTGEMRCVVKGIISDDSQETSDSIISDVCTTVSNTDSDVCALSEITKNATVHESEVNNDIVEDVKSKLHTSNVVSSRILETCDRERQISSTIQKPLQISAVASDTESIQDGSQKPEQQKDIVLTDNGISPQTRSRRSSCLQKPSSNLEKLLELFQHPGSLFSSAPSIEKLDLKNPLQNSMNNVMALGDKFHSYLRETKGSRECSPQPPLQRSVSDAQQPSVKLDPVKSSSVPQLSSIHVLTSGFSASRIEENSERDTNTNGSLTCSSTLGIKLQQTPLTELRNNVNDNTTPMPQCKCEEETLHRISEQSLLENVQSKVNNINKSNDLGLNEAVDPNTTVLDSNGIVNSVPVNMLDNKLTMCVPKLKDIPEYSVLEISGIEVEPGGIQGDNAKTVEKVICDSSTTDSINLTSDRNSSPRNIICDKQNVINVVSLDRSVVVDNLMTPLFECTTENFSPVLNETVDNVAINLCKNDGSKQNDSYSKNSKLEDIQNDHVNINLLEDRITGALYNIDDNNDVTGNERVESMAIFHTIHTDNLEETTNANTCHLDNILHPESTTIDENFHSSTSMLETSFKDKISDIKIGDIKIKNSTPLYNESIENLNDVILKAESLTSNHAARFSTPQVTRKNGSSPQKDTFQAIYETPEHSDPDKTNSKYQVNLNEKSTFTSINNSVEYDKLDSDELIFNITDISTDTVLEAHDLSLDSKLNQLNDLVETPQSNSSANVTCIKNQLKSHSPQVVQSPTSLFIEESKGMHRNSHDSGIEENNLSMSADSIPESTTQHLFQESTESGIDLEWLFASLDLEDSSTKLLKDTIKVPAGKDTVNKSEDNCGESDETIKDMESRQTSTVSLEVGSKEKIVCETVSTESCSTKDIDQTITVTSMCSRNDHGEIDTMESEEIIEKLLVEISSEGRDTEISGCSAVVCSISHQ